MTPKELAAIEDIKRLKASYFRLVDTKQWAAWRNLFTEDVRVQLDRERSSTSVSLGRSAPPLEFIGADAIVEHARRHMQDCVSVHHGHMPEIELISEHEAKG